MTEMLVRKSEIYHQPLSQYSLLRLLFTGVLSYFPGLSLQSVLFRETDVYLQFLSKAPGKLWH